MANENHHDAAASSTVPLQLLDKKQLRKTHRRFGADD